MPNDTEVEQEIARLVKLAHPQDQGKPTEILEQELRAALHTSLVAAVEGLKYQQPHVDTPFHTEDKIYAMNATLDQVLTIINSIIKE